MENCSKKLCTSKRNQFENKENRIKNSSATVVDYSSRSNDGEVLVSIVLQTRHKPYKSESVVKQNKNQTKPGIATDHSFTAQH